MSGALALAPCPPEAAGRSLEEHLTETLDRVRACEDAECPVCGAAMELYGEGARCEGCDSILA